MSNSAKALSSRRKTLALVAALSIVIALIAVSLVSRLPTSPATPTQTTATTSPATRVVLSGAGATFLAPQMFEWARMFKEVKGISVEYQSVGSGAGRDMFFNKVVHFAGSDPPLSKELYSKYAGKVMQIPVVVGSVALVYNIPGMPINETLCLSADVIAQIYKGEIRYWDDERVLAINPHLKGVLPHREITAVHRSDSSGTTSVFTAYLNKAVPVMWTKDLVGLTVDWPVDRVGRGVGGKGNEGVTQAVKSTPYSLGYVELNYAVTQGLPVAAIKNAAGRCVKPTTESVLNALSGVAGKLPSSPLDDWSDVPYLILDAPGEGSYPIASFSYIFVYKKYPDAQVVLALREFINWLCSEGQNRMIPGYLPLPSVAIQVCLKASELLEVGEIS